MAEQFYFSNEAQDALIASIAAHPQAFAEIAPLIKPDLMWGMNAARVTAALQDYRAKYGKIPTLTAVDLWLQEKYSRDKIDVYQEVHEYIEKLRRINTRDWKHYGEVALSFIRERAHITAIKKAAEMVRENKVPKGGFAKMFEEVQRVGQVLERSKTLREIVELPENPAANLMGDRFLCQGGSLFINGPTGIGKSSLVMQFSVLAALGRPFFGIPFNRPLTVLIIQNENDREDIIEEICGVVLGLDLNGAEAAKPLAAVRIRTVDTIGDDFLAEFEMLLRNEPSDLVVIDPLLGFFSGGDIRTAKDAGKFVRQGILRLARQYQVGLVCVNHTNKPPGQKNQASELTGSDLAYLGAGAADIANAARASIALQSTGNYDVFRLSLAKRAQRADFINANDERCKSLLIRHSKTGICWEPATKEDKQKLEADLDGTEAILNLIPEGGISIDSVLQKAVKLKPKIGENRCRRILAVLEENLRVRHEGGTGRKRSRYFLIPGAEQPELDVRPPRRLPNNRNNHEY